MKRYTTKGFHYESGSPMSRLQELENKIDDGELVEVKHGEWIEHEDDWCGNFYTCSVCKCDWTTIDGNPQENNMRYCPECGAKMKGEENE